MARTDDVEDWVRRGYIKVEEAGDVFTGYLDSLDRDQRARLSRTNYVVARLTSVRYPLDAAARLVGVGLWRDCGDHFEHVDYTKNYSVAAQRWSPSVGMPVNGSAAAAPSRVCHA
jgi:hypothetical protein